MQAYQRQFIEFALERQVLRFGQFTLKSGRQSPYFFNAGLFNDGVSLKKLGEFYAAAIIESKLGFDQLFGPAYKGITLATTTAIALSQCNQNIPVSFNRKEVKDHGEGGNLIGAPLQGRILIIDDVITAGTAFRESYQLINAQKASVCGVVVALNRQERGLGTLSSIQEIEQDYHIPVLSIVSLTDVITYLRELQHPMLDTVLAYHHQYGVAD